MITTRLPPSATTPKRILFVDDDELLLEGLRDALRPYRHQWSMRFVADGETALAAIAAEPHDVIVSDLRMPGLDGAALLARVEERSPSTVRIVLSGHADINAVSRAAASAHRLIAKPCETDELARIIARSCALRDIAERVELDPRAAGASALPSVPRAYAQLTELLRSGSAGAGEIAHVINHDIAMAAKVLQLANSAYFGRRQATTSVANAVAYLGTDTLRALLLHAEAFRVFRVVTPIPGFDLNNLQRHCTRVALLATAIVKDTGSDGDAFTAGLLHDIGMLILAVQSPDDLAQMLAIAHKENRPLAEIEREGRSASHAEIGAHLLALWGLPHAVTEAVAGHHDSTWLHLPFDTVAAVHVANALVEAVEASHDADALPPHEPDLDYLADAGLLDSLERWQRLAEELVLEPGNSPSAHP
ncbi:MAG TPA: response regulator [Solirubrobacteraceae bacterium]|nr:response regulator [Solirubrobacteraceae bacterium]